MGNTALAGVWTGIVSRGEFEVDNMSFSWDEDRIDESLVLQDLAFQAGAGEFISVIGPSGCGKSTLLSIMAGLLRPTVGRVVFDCAEVLSPRREINIVFQDYGLFPWLRVFGNVEFGLKLQGVAPTLRRTRCKEILQAVGLSSAAKKYPHELSGGMRQRAAIARVLANNPECMLMDEPFAALDYQTRLDMQKFLLDVWMRFQKTIVFVTHHVDEAILLADRVILLTARPSKIAGILRIDLPRPRDITSEGFNRYRVPILEHLEREVTSMRRAEL